MKSPGAIGAGTDSTVGTATKEAGRETPPGTLATLTGRAAATTVATGAITTGSETTAGVRISSTSTVLSTSSSTFSFSFFFFFFFPPPAPVPASAIATAAATAI